jgi:hypothetical protein
MDDEIQIETTTDVAAIADARRRRPGRTTPVDRLLGVLPFGPDDPRLTRATPEDRSEFLHGLERVAADVGTANHRREDAIRLLLSLAPDRGWPRVEALLDSPEAAARRRGLFLAAGQPGGLGPAAIARALADPEPEVQEVALGLALGAGMAEAADPGRVTPVVDRLLSEGGATWSRVALLSSLVAQGGDASRHARGGLHAFVATQPSSRHFRDAILALVEHATLDDESWLRSVLADPPEDHVAGRALVALAGLRKAAFLGELEPRTQDRKLAVHAVEAIGVAARGTGSPVAVRLLRGAVGHLDYRGPRRLIHALLLIGGRAARSELAGYLARLRDSVMHRLEVMNALWVLNETRPSNAARELLELGISPSLPDSRELARLDAQAESTLVPYTVACGVLHRAYVVATFDAEASRVPCGHDRPLVLLAGYSRGQFAPEAAVEDCELAGLGHRADRYTLQFVHRERLYRVRFPNEGDYYHVRAVEAAANAALRDAGRPERFQRLVTGDQTAALLFADPDQVRQAAQRLLLATEDAGAAIAAAIDELA